MSLISKPVVVVGGDVGVGVHIIERLYKEGFIDIRCVGRSTFPGTDTTTFDICRVSSFVCNICSTDKDTVSILGKALFGASTVICVTFPQSVISISENFQNENIDAVKTLLRECEVFSIDSFIFISSVAVLGQSVSHLNVNEDNEMNEVRSSTSTTERIEVNGGSSDSNVYEQTLRRCENLVLDRDDSVDHRKSVIDDGLDSINDEMWSVVLRCPQHILNTHKDLSGRLEDVNYLLYQGARVDTIDGMNVAWACYLALKTLNQAKHSNYDHQVNSSTELDSKLNTTDSLKLNKQIFYITKGEPITLHELSLKIQRRINNKIVIIPTLMFQVIYLVLWLVFTIRYWVLFFQDDCGIPLHTLLRNGKKYHQTFSNDKARQVLNYYPVISFDETIDRLIDEWTKEREKREGGEIVE